jgi:hypothetical protein
METPRRQRHARPLRCRGTWRPSMAYLLIAALLLAAGIAYWLYDPAMPGNSSGAEATPQSQAGNGATAWPLLASVFSKAPATAQETAPGDQEGRDPSSDLSDYLPKGATPGMGEVIERLHKAGIHTGLGAFNPPGTRPPKVGLAVPEDYPLPEGYVRHYQSTDDGQRIEPILMFAPDKQVLDANNRPIDIPADRVVPPELAPPGFPVRRIDIPPPLQSGN